MDPTQFTRDLQKKGLRLTANQLHQFAIYYRLLVTVNRHVNLTAITSRDAVYLKHFYDSLTPAFYVEGLRHHHLSICDVGTGAGFPSLPLKIAFPQLTVTLVDSLNKRVRFLRSLVDKLGLRRVNLVHARAEDLGRSGSRFRERYDLVLARAVARLNVLAEYCLPLVRIGGEFVAMKSVQVDRELKRARSVIDLLGGNVIATRSFYLPNSTERRSLVVIRKRKRTPAKYPRRAGIPKRRPL